jgi:hypothetical protein
MFEYVVPAMYVGALVGSWFYTRRHGLTGLLQAHIFFVPWFGLLVHLGLTISVDRILGLFVIGWVLLRVGPKGFGAFGLFLAYAFLNTIAQSVNLPPTVSDYPALQGEWRWAFQLFIWGVLILPGAVIAARPDPQFVRRCLRALFAAAVVLCVLGLVQYGIHLAVGVDIFPINMTQMTDEGISGSFMVGSRQFFRASGLAGEPKHLGYTAAIGLTLLAAEWVYGEVLSLGRKTRNITGLILFSAIILTFSTQGLMLAAVNVLLVVLSGPLRGRTSWGRARGLLIATVVVVLVIAFIPGLWELLQLRTVDRLAETGGMEDWNLAVLDWIAGEPSAWPLGVGLGNVHLYAAGHIPAEYLYYMGGKVFVAKAGILRIFSELGFVGVVLILATVFRPIVKLLRPPRGSSGLVAAMPIVTLAVFADFCVTQDGPWYLYVVLGCCYAMERFVALGCPDVTEATTA